MRLDFVKKQRETGEIWSYFFKPHSMPGWRAGQYLNLTMPGVAPVFADRILTIASAPHEPLLQFTTILTPSPFKQKLDSLQPGDEIEADQLGGDFTYDLPIAVIPAEAGIQTKRLFIAGGIGVTPYFSIIRDRLHTKQPLNTQLLYAGKDGKRPFIDELHAAARQDPTLQIKEYVHICLTLRQLLNDVPDIEHHIVYLAGSQTFSETLGEGLIKQGFPRSQIKYDYFDGYIDIEY